MMAAVVNEKFNVRESPGYVIWSNPVFRILGMLVIAIFRQTVADNEILLATIVVPVLSAYIIMHHCRHQALLIIDLNKVRIQAVPLVADNIGTVKIDHGH